MRGGLRSKGQPCRLNETRQLRRLEAGGTGTHVEFYPVGEHEAHPGTPLWGYVRGAHWHLEGTIEPRRNLGKWHSGFLQLADVDEAFKMRRGVVWSAPRPERSGQQPTLDVVTHGATCYPPQIRQFFDAVAALVPVTLAHSSLP
jgi:hypothetical protein